MIDTKYTFPTKNIWFPNQKEPLYDPDDPVLMEVFLAYWRQEKKRMREGFYIGDVYISGWLYWHTVYWKIAMYIENEILKKKIRIIETPYLRDIEWIIADDLTQCEIKGKFYNLVGARDFGKSIIAASRAAYQYTLFDNSEALITGGEYTYIKLVTDKIEDGLINLHPILQKQRIISDWKKEIVAGWKDKKTNQPSAKSSMSAIKIRNYEGGTKSMAAVGTRPGFHLIDEIGTIKGLIACVKDSEGAWWSGQSSDPTSLKPSCLPMITGTGGDMEVGAEAAEIFFKPEAYNMLAFDNPEIPGGKMGRFINALIAKMQHKKPTTLAKYLGVDNPELDRIKILVSDQQEAQKWWDSEYRRALKSGNQKTVLKFKAYWPINPSDSFLVLTKNDFNIDAAKSQQARIRSVGKTGTPVKLYHDGEKIIHEFTDKLPISDFPVKDSNTDAPVIIWEFPVEDVPPFGLYTAGVDSYRQSSSENSDSLGAVYIFKRVHDLQSDKYQNLFVASYVARPNSKDIWNETARCLIKYYNAYTLVENDDYSFIDYMIKRGDAARYLCPQPQWLREIVPNTTVRRDYGIHRSNDRIRDHLNDLLKRYLDEPIYHEKDNYGNIIPGSEILGVSRVFDIMLLEEIIKFNSEEGNYDRVVAASLAIALAEHLNPQFVVASTEQDPRLKSYFSKRKTSSQSIVDFSQNRRRPGRPKLFT